MNFLHLNKTVVLFESINQMEKDIILQAIQEARKSPKRNFIQGYEIVINFKDLDIKKPEHQLNLYIPLKKRGKKIKICAFCGPEMSTQAKDVCDRVIVSDEFDRFSKKEIKKLAEEFDYFIAQGNIMNRVASVFGRVLGPRGKMPNPKAGCVIAPNTNLSALYEKLQNTVNTKIRKDPSMQCSVGNEGMKDEEIADNIMTIYDTVIHNLPNEKDNVDSVSIKLTMGKPISLTEKQEISKAKRH